MGTVLNAGQMTDVEGWSEAEADVFDELPWPWLLLYLIVLAGLWLAQTLWLTVTRR